MQVMDRDDLSVDWGEEMALHSVNSAWLHNNVVLFFAAGVIQGNLWVPAKKRHMLLSAIHCLVTS